MPALVANGLLLNKHFLFAKKYVKDKNEPLYEPIKLVGSEWENNKEQWK